LDEQSEQSSETIPDIFLDRLKRDYAVTDKPRVTPDIDSAAGDRSWLDRMTLWMVK
jgi:hypothetical protein